MCTVLFTSLHKLLTIEISREKLCNIELIYDHQATCY